MRRAVLIATALLVWMTSVACAETIELEEIGIRYETAAEEQTLTRTEMPEEALDLLGIDAAQALSSMEAERSWLMVLGEEGRQISLTIEPAPEGLGATDASALDAQGRETLLKYVARAHDAFSATWLLEPNDLIFSQSKAEGPLTMHVLSLDTLYVGQIYGFGLSIIGREPTEADEQALMSVAKRTLRLGGLQSGTVEGTTLSLPDDSLPTDPAEQVKDNNDVALTVEPIAAVVGGVQVPITGQVEAGTRVRIRVNTTTTGNINVNEDGTFSVTARGLSDGVENAVSVIARNGDLTTTLTMRITVQRQDTPLVLEVTEATSYENAYTIRGITLPGASVRVSRNGTALDATPDENGVFTFSVNTRKEGTFPFTVQAEYPGRRRTEQSGKVRRQSDQTLKANTEELDWAALAASPADYAATGLWLTGTVRMLTYQNGQPLCLMDVENGGAVLVLFENLLTLHAGDTLTLVAELTGESLTLDGTAYPTARPAAIIPNE